MANPSKHHVVCGLLLHMGHVLLVHRSPSKDKNPSVWDFPGGHVEPGENSLQALVRELREELDVEISPPSGEALFTHEDGQLVLEVWRVDEWDGEVVNAAPEEHDDFGWFSLEEAASLNLAHTAYPALFRQVLS